MRQAGWMRLAERVAKARAEAIADRIEQAISDHAPDALIETDGDSIRVRGRGLLRRWISEPSLRFATRLRP